MNTRAQQEEIKRLIESCETPNGGFTSGFFECVGVEMVPGNGFCIPAGWKLYLMQSGDLSTIRAGVERYHAEPQWRMKASLRRRFDREGSGTLFGAGKSGV
jgi:hypothetical protein